MGIIFVFFGYFAVPRFEIIIVSSSITVHKTNMNRASITIFLKGKIQTCEMMHLKEAFLRRKRLFSSTHGNNIRFLFLLILLSDTSKSSSFSQNKSEPRFNNYLLKRENSNVWDDGLKEAFQRRKRLSTRGNNIRFLFLLILLSDTSKSSSTKGI